MKYNYHTHTARCGHASGEDREYVLTAIRAGVEDMGFSDHAPFRFPDGHESPFRVPTARAEDYVRSVCALREEFKDRISLHLGFEMEYYPSYFQEMLASVKALGAEYLILGQHFIDEERTGNASVAPHASEAELKTYADTVVEGMESGAFLYVAHPDVFCFTGADEIYEREMRKICRASRTTGVPLEINFLGLRANRTYPRESFWKLAGEENVPVVFGFDAHEAKHADGVDSEARARELVKKYGLRLIENFKIKKKFF